VYLRGIVVRLKTGGSRQAGTDDPLFLGATGSAGGREFPLDVQWFDDAQRGSDVKYALGDVWEEAALAGAKRPRMAEADWNDPKLAYVGFDAIDRVYLRKHAGRRASDDDAYQLDLIEVQLFGDPGQRRVFRCTTAIWLGVRFGLQVWLPEVG
jgi:hypothetical protein